MTTAAQSGFQGLRAKARESRKKGRFLDPTIPVPGTGLRLTIFHSCAKSLAFFLDISEKLME